MNKNIKKLTFGTANKRQRYSIRKLTIGAASVLLGTTFLFGAGQTVQADTTGQESEQKEETVQLNKNETAKTTQSTNVGDASSTDTSASDVHEQNKQVTTNNYTTQSEEAAKQETNNQEKTNNVDVKNQNGGVEPQATSAINNTDVKENGSTDSKVTKDISTSKIDNKKADDSQNVSGENKNQATKTDENITSESGKTTDKVQTQTLKVTGTAPLSAQALAESKVEDPITVTVKLHGTDGNGNDEIVTSISYKGKDGDTLKNVGEYVQQQINKDNNGYMQPNISGIDTVDSPLVTTYKTVDDYIPGFGGYDEITDPTLKSEYDKWYADKKKNHLLAGYTIDIDSLSSDPLVNGQTYNLTLDEEKSTTQFPVYHPMTRTINYVKYIKNNSTETAHPSVVQDGQTNIHNSPNTVVKNYQKEEGNRTLLVYGTIKRYYNVATGIPAGDDEYAATGTYILFPEQDNPEITDWMTPDPDVVASANPGEGKYTLMDRPKSGVWYAFINHTLYQGDGRHNTKNLGKDVFEVDPITITYYHNQPVDLSFEDISPIDPQDLSENNYEASNELTYDNTASNQYNVYDALNKNGKNLNAVIESIEAKGYKLVSITNDDDNSHTDLKGNSQINLTYNKDGVWKSETGGDSAENLIHKRYTIKFEHNIAKNQTIKTSTTRTVHYVADDEQHSVLRTPDTQKVVFNITGDIDLATNSYVDPTTHAEIKVTKNDDGTYTMAIDDAAQVSDWKTDDSFGKIQKDKFNNDGLVPGVWNIEYASDSTADGAKLADKFAPAVNKVSAKKYNDIYLVYNKATAAYNIHYVDVNESDKTSDFVPTDGEEMTAHLVSNINGDVGERSHATNLWNTYGDEGYVVVGFGNVSDNNLGKQVFAEGMKDQYVYLKHKAVKITSTTHKDEVPKTSNVDPTTLSKTAERIIHYVSDKDGTPLLNDTKQTLNFEGTEYVDVHNGKVVQVTTATDAMTGKTVMIAVNKPGSITWAATAGDGSTVDTNGASFNEVTKPVITNGLQAGTWTVTDSTANNAPKDDKRLDPNKEFDPSREVTLRYTQDVNADIVYIDDTTGETLIPKAQDTDEHGKPGQDVHFAKDPQKTISDFEKEGYLLVRDDFGKGQKYGETDSHYEIHFVHGVTPDTKTQSVVRVIHYVTKNGNQVLLDPTSQFVRFTKTTYTDKVTHKTVGVKEVKDSEGNTVVASDGKETTPTWVADNGKDSFDQVTKPVINDGKLPGEWYVTKASAKNAPEFPVPDPSDPKFKTTYDVTLEYGQKAQYNIHYIDVNGIENENEYQSKGTNLGHDVTGVGSAEGTYVGDAPDVTNSLWKQADYEKAGYILVGMSDNAKNNQLGKQTLTRDVQDQYVYLKHAVKTITSKTPIDEVPKNPDGKPVVDPNDLHKEFTRHITFVANDTNHSPLKDEVTQTVSFDRHIYVDVVTGKTTTPETVKDADGNDVQVATTNPGQIIWDKSSQTMEAVDQPTITLNSGDRYATSDSMIGTWKLVSGKADAIDLTPSSSNPKDVQLVYEKEVQPGGNTGDKPGDQPSGKPSDNPGNEPSNNPGGQPGNEPSNNPGNEPSNNPGGQPGDKGSKTPGKPDENKPSEPKQDDTKKPEEKAPSNKSTKKSPVKSNKTKQSKKTPKPAKKIVNKTSNNIPRSENMYRNNVPTPESDNATMPKSEVSNQTSAKPAGLVNSTTVGANSEKALPQTGEKQSNAAVIGLIALAFAGLASFVGVDRKKKRN